jgi:hypothetical protein
LKGARAWKVLYRSTLHDGKAVTVSGLVVAPAGKPKRGRRVVAWAHGSSPAPREWRTMISMGLLQLEDEELG